jgi:hypothetical protein
VVEQALEALEGCVKALDALHAPGDSIYTRASDSADRAEIALRKALEQQGQEQEPVDDAETWLRNRYGAARGHLAWRELIEAFNAGRTAAQEQGPVAWTTKGQIAAMENGFLHYIQGRVPRFVNPSENDVALYTHPPRREWQSLTEEEKADILFPLTAAGASDMECARAIEQALKEKNK